MTTGVKDVGVLLVNLGTPASPAVGDVRRYLHEFLSDPRVLDTHPVARALLLYGVVLPFRPRRSAAAYAKVWLDEGSPLLVHSRALREAVAKDLGDAYRTELAMRYGEPSIEGALRRLSERGATRLVVVPLFPQYAGSSTGSALERVYGLAASHWNVASLRVVEPFYAEPDFIRALAAVAQPELAEFAPDYVLMSYHGLPERQVHKSDLSGSHCLARADCCDAIEGANTHCYRAQCYATSRALARELGLESAKYGVSFQSRLGRTPWIQPFTDLVLPDLAARGVRRLAVLCPSFVADCLETVEEIGIRGRQQWSELGGEALHLVPCLNGQPQWAASLASWVRRAAEA